MNLILVGFMGSGKSEAGRRLAERLGMLFADTDEMVEAKAGIPIAQIFQQQGEGAFREFERDAVRIALAGDAAVVATGGGAVIDEENVGLMRDSGIVFYLEVGPRQVERRTGGDSSRPLLDVRERRAAIERLLEERRPLYERAAHERVNTDELAIEQVVEEILNRWRRYA
ncbi:MAG: shikimate kinase [Candidatus Geothermincolia bacterium]